MTQYMLSVHTGPDTPHEPITEAQEREGFAKVGSLDFGALLEVFRTGRP